MGKAFASPLFLLIICCLRVVFFLAIVVFTVVVLSTFFVFCHFVRYLSLNKIVFIRAYRRYCKSS